MGEKGKSFFIMCTRGETMVSDDLTNGLHLPSGDLICAL